MILERKVFKFEVLRQPEGGFYRTATGTSDIFTLGCDDVADVIEPETGVKISPDNDVLFIIHSLRQVKSYFYSRVCALRIALTVTVLALVISSVMTVFSMMRNGIQWNTFLGVAIFVVLATLIALQALKPVAQDVRGNWIDLRTGETNLNGGCKIVDTPLPVWALIEAVSPGDSDA